MDLFTYPFMQRALIAGSILAILLAALGVFATLRKMAFFGEGVAHASLAGIAIAILTGLTPLPVAVLWAIAVSLFLFWLERYTRLPSDTLIGIFLTGSMSLGVVLMNFTEGYQPELLSFLFGSILSITTTDVYVIVGIAFVTLIWLAVYRRQLTFMSLSEESAEVSGVNTYVQTMLLYVALGVATVLGVKILGIILVSALLVLPPATARMVTESFKSYTILSIIISFITVISGLVLSLALDLPSGAVIVLIGTVLFFLTALIHKH